MEQSALQSADRCTRKTSTQKDVKINENETHRLGEMPLKPPSFPTQDSKGRSRGRRSGKRM